jgi:hypothetical protein
MCMSGIALVLGLYNDQRVPTRWPLGITLNAYISVLSAIGKYTMAVPLDEALGQLRWLYFASRPRKLIDFERFDDATRGPWGALALLIYTRARCATFTVFHHQHLLTTVQDSCIIWGFYHPVVSGSGSLLSTARLLSATA